MSVNEFIDGEVGLSVRTKLNNIIRMVDGEDAISLGNTSVTGTFTSRGIDDNADATAITIDSSENVGIGTNTPSRIFQVESSNNTLGLFKSTDSVANILLEDNATNTGVGIQVVGNNLQFLNNNLAMVTIDQLGRIGVGKTTPDTDFQIKSTAPTVSFDESDATSNNKKWDISVQSEQLRMRAVDDAYTTATDFLRVDRTGIVIDSITLPYGNVGIGTATPNAYGTQTTLTINGTDCGRLDLESGDILRGSVWGTSTGMALYTPSLVDLLFTIGGSDKAIIKSDGNFGIGTTSPTQLLQLAGTTGETSTHYTNNATGFTSGDGFRVGVNATGQPIIWSVEAGIDMVFGTASNTRMTIKSTGVVNFTGTPVHADNAAALVGGLVAGDRYRTSTGQVMETY